MSQLDHRILIPKSSEAVWQYLSDFANNPAWQTDCKTLSFLTSKRNSAGMRWRYTTASGREYVAETTAWYDGLGYEYTFVDGTPFRESKGRLRLQEIAEGTVVQWTFSYELGGVLGGLMNAVSARRQIESAMIDSLRLLWKEMQKVSAEQPFEAKSLMRDALDYEARAQYKPRHTPVKPPAGEVITQDAPATIPEPPITEEDTRPRQPVKLVTDIHEPVFLSSLAATGEHAPVTPVAE
ncbi:MAG: SRPBCC family protein, partial [Anaerolineae bacterium]|nr:SRPBCC family protein [Anaerolineae bacterium]